MKVKRTEVLDYLIIYWMIIYVFIISWFAYINQGAMVMVSLIIIRLLADFKRSLKLPSLYLGIIFAVIYPILNYYQKGGTWANLSENIFTIFATTMIFVYLAYISQYKRSYIIEFIKKRKKTFNLYMVINIPVLFLQLSGYTELSGRHPEILTNTFSEDLVSGLFGYNGTGLLTMFFCFLMVYNYSLFKNALIKNKKIFIAYNVIILAIVAFVAANSDNKSLFLLVPMLFFTSYFIFKLNKCNDFVDRIMLSLKYIFFGLVIIGIFFFVFINILKVGIVIDILDKIVYGWNNATAAHGSAERFGMIAYALTSPQIRWGGMGIGYNLWHEAYTLGFAHFGISDMGAFLCMGGLSFVIIGLLFLFSVYRKVFKETLHCYVFIILTVLILVYTQLITVTSLTCSWCFFVISILMGCETFAKGAVKNAEE